MSKMLYIQASPRQERSYSVRAAEAFIEAYKKTHPKDAVETRKIFEMNLPAFDGPAIKAKYAIMHGQQFTPEERRGWNEVEKVIEEFKSFDKYIFALGMWNFGIPYRLKQYIDLLVQPGYTFKAGDNGYEGLVTGRPAMLVCARGGSYEPGTDAEKLDMQRPYMELILGFIGFQEIGSIVVEPTLGKGPEAAKEALDKAIKKARELAKTF